MIISDDKKGITLIALIITVIILLILAGTAISVAVNGGDLFSKASTAREEWNIAVENEQQSIMSLLNSIPIDPVKGIEKVAIYCNGNSSMLTVKAHGGEYYKYSIDNGSNWSDTIPNGTTYDFTGLTQNQTYTVKAKIFNANGNGSEIISQDIKIAYEGNIGKYVHYAIDLGIGETSGDNALDDDWVVFYEEGIGDESITYLIAADYVLNEYITDATSGTSGRAGLIQSSNSTYTFAVMWGNPSVSYTNTTIPQNRVLSNYSSWYVETENNGVKTGNLLYDKQKASASLLDITLWDDIVLKKSDNTPYDTSIQAVGSPTVELWIASWNQRGYKNYKWLVENSETYGPGYRTAEKKEDAYMDTYTTLSNNGDKVYFPTTGGSKYSNGYWLASPNANSNTGSLSRIRTWGNITNGTYDNDYFGVRPVVSMKTSLIASSKSVAESNNMSIYYTGVNINN